MIHRDPSITNEHGEFKSSKEYRSAKEDFVVLDEVILEIEAQYERFVELTGRQPQYFEGHAVSSKKLFQRFRDCRKSSWFKIQWNGSGK